MSFICRDERYGAARLADRRKCGHKVVFVGKSGEKMLQASRELMLLKSTDDKLFFFNSGLL